MKLAFVYDRVNKIGGAERILQTLLSLYPDSILYTAVYHPEKAKWARKWKIEASFINKLSFARAYHELYPWLTPIAFENFNFEEFDMVICITSAEAKGIITKPDTFHLCYCLTPTRYLWSDYELYKKQLYPPLRFITRPVFSYLREWDKIACNRPDKYLAISETVKRRINKYYKKDSQVIYPPVDITSFKKRNNKNIEFPINKFYLVVSRLVVHKRVELAIKACNQLKKPLIIVGTGVQIKKLKKISGPTIYFVGELTDEELVRYYQKCDALLFPQEEDFGISIVEAQAAGKAVIAYNSGGATEILIEGKTGIFFSEQKTSSLIEAIKKFETIRYDSKLCQDNAQRFSKERFEREFSYKIKEIWLEHQKKEEQ